MINRSYAYKLPGVDFGVNTLKSTANYSYCMTVELPMTLLSLDQILNIGDFAGILQDSQVRRHYSVLEESTMESGVPIGAKEALSTKTSWQSPKAT
ncbi:hypothetical protein P3T76_009035 [Phytophthora citrophthora]|uniref:Uncharacterized protein n=1 Tax=Phytophthora citrophthora TaxID=4793 RepID=A0AAD9LJM9_9STRA|nr:hypothetical protein P3T76_009035 [Phytophthora citrophthora]